MSNLTFNKIFNYFYLSTMQSGLLAYIEQIINILNDINKK